MIITFTTNYKASIDYVSVNGSRPMQQASMGCRSMFDAANRLGSISFSDKFIPTWGPAKLKWNQYWYCHIKDHGQVGHGFVDGRVSDALGFMPGWKDKEGAKMIDAWWSAGNNTHLMTAEEYKKYLDMTYNKTQAAADAYLAGLFPAMAKIDDVETPVVAKRGKAKPVAVIAPIV